MGHAASTSAQPWQNPQICEEPPSDDECEEMTLAEENALRRTLLEENAGTHTAAEQSGGFLAQCTPDLLAVVATQLNVESLQCLRCTCRVLAHAVLQAVQDELSSSIMQLDCLVQEDAETCAAAMNAFVNSSAPPLNVRLTVESLFVLVVESEVLESERQDHELMTSMDAFCLANGNESAVQSLRIARDLQGGGPGVPERAPNRWQQGAKLLSNPHLLHSTLLQLSDDKMAIPHERFVVLQSDPVYKHYFSEILPAFLPEQVREHSAPCAAVCRWLHAMHKDHFVVRPWVV